MRNPELLELAQVIAHDVEMDARKAAASGTSRAFIANQRDEPWVFEDGAWRQDDC